MEKVLTKKFFPKWVEKLKSYKIYAPVKENEHWSYTNIDDPENIDLDYPLTTLSPKKIIFPQREIFLEFTASNEGGTEVKEILPAEEPSVIFGVKPCEAIALTLTDKVFSGDIKDPYYWKRRNQTTLIGISCNTPPSPNCFCVSVNGSPYSKEGLDILMTDIGDKYYIEILTKKGEKLLNLAKGLFKSPTANDKKNTEQIHIESKKKIKRQIENIKKIPPKLKEMFDSPFWDEESMSCLQCGICTYLCPTCHCFDINDEIASSSPIKGKRIRTWDTCQFPDFTMHSSGHNPRPDKASRLRQRILHKFQYFVDRYQNYQCTGCGRCISFCPVGIDLIKVLDKVSDYGL